MNNFFIISNRMKDPDFEFGGKVRDYLVSRGASCTEAFGDPDGKQVAPEKTDLIIVLGGDGTMLKAADDNAGGRVPLLGINLGQLGYMAEIEKEGWKEALDSVLSGDYEIEERMMLEGRSARTGETMEALNDIVITRAGKLQVVGIDVYVNGQFLNRYEADGIIVSTPTGSTAYNLSAGGPIVEPQARLILMTPICAHTLNTRTIIFSPNDTINCDHSRRNKDRYSPAFWAKQFSPRAPAPNDCHQSPKSRSKRRKSPFPSAVFRRQEDRLHRPYPACAPSRADCPHHPRNARSHWRRSRGSGSRARTSQTADGYNEAPPSL